ncbi:hypothetical protein KUCAC02_000841 [Chaenocephalus aceratus]|uniref:Uncharacterized protein n=1 Tax=Chaenocephalus aceratus TaxID=36190 RepID=A0ACB9W6Q0_CHAAC|nr:hypothetical protein KUCAC02_000841 [Chaenocephalus aceratus]
MEDSNLGKKRSELKLVIEERTKKLDEIEQSIKVIKVSRLRASNDLSLTVCRQTIRQFWTSGSSSYSDNVCTVAPI